MGRAFLRASTIAALAVGAILVQVQSASGDGELRLNDLWKLDHTKQEDPAQQALAKEMFPLGRLDVQEFLREALGKPLESGHLSGIATVLYAHGPDGFVWGLEQIAKARNPQVTGNVADALSLFDYRETYVLYVCLLDDRGFVFHPYHVRHGLWSNSVCYLAGKLMCWKLEQRGQLPAWLKARCTFEQTRELEEGRARMDSSIRLLKDWWAKEGERLITGTKPSVIDEIVKQGLKGANDAKEKDGKKD